MKNNFFDLLQYTSNELDFINEQSANDELDYYLNLEIFPNISLFDIIDYEKLIYIELRFLNNKEIQEKITRIKYLISQNYYDRKKLINRLMYNKNY